MAGRHIRYNSAGKQYEYSTTGTNEGPWTVLDLSGNISGGLPANVAYKDVNNNFSAIQNFASHISVTGNIYELGRIAALGYWTNFTPILAGTGGITLNNNYSSSYMLIGKTIFVRFYWNITTGPIAQTSFQIPIPGGFVSTDYSSTSFQYGTDTAMAHTPPNSTILLFYRDTMGGATWPINYSIIMGGTAIFQIN